MLPLKRKNSSRIYIIAFIDGCIVLFFSQIMLMVITAFFGNAGSLPSYALPMQLLFFTTMIFSAIFNTYSSQFGTFSWEILWRLSVAWLCIVLSMSFIFVITKTNYSFSRFWFISTCFLSFITCLIWRVLTVKKEQKKLQSYYKKLDLLIIKPRENVGNKLQRLMRSLPHQFRNVFEYEWKTNNALEQLEVMLKEDAGKQEKNIGQVWIVGGGDINRSSIEELIQIFRQSLVEISYFPDVSALPYVSPRISTHLGFPAVSLTVQPLSTLDYLLKSTFDFLFSIIVLFIIGPIFCLIALMVKLSSKGPIFYFQERMTRNGQVFNMIKFRTMPVNVEDESGPVWAKKGETRATKFGQFLRKTSLDELPQFINVIKGDMSVVGPRPERPYFIDRFKDEMPSYMQKHSVKAGITGLAQVRGFRGNTSIEQRLELDLQYIQNWSFLLDIKIIFLTLFQAFFSDEAY